MPNLILAVLPDLGADDRLPLDAAAAERRAREILDRAEQEARHLMDGAQQKAAALLDAARREGALQGHADALAAGQAAVADAVGILGAAAERVRRLEAEGVVGRERVVIAMALALAERILGAAIAEDSARMLPVVQAALAALPPAGPVTLRVHPVVADVVAAQPQIATPELTRALSIIPDATLPPGGCVAEGGATTVDAGLAVQLAEADRRMREEPW
ncbi:MAG TPA: FliH/SctL family protein [Candidatus Baltobacteraceae bacterium]|nr:FliH/SctL family protein [Candidatus Baltobacteraceae bacterium]